MTDTLKMAMIHADFLFEELKNVELIYGDDEINLFNKLEG